MPDPWHLIPGARRPPRVRSSFTLSRSEVMRILDLYLVGTRGGRLPFERPCPATGRAEFAWFVAPPTCHELPGGATEVVTLTRRSRLPAWPWRLLFRCRSARRLLSEGFAMSRFEMFCSVSLGLLLGMNLPREHLTAMSVFLAAVLVTMLAWRALRSRRP